MAPVKKNLKKAAPAEAAPVVETPEVAAMTELVAKLSIEGDRLPTAAAIAKTFQEGGAKALKANELYNKLQAAASDAEKSADARLGAVVAFAELWKVNGGRVRAVRDRRAAAHPRPPV